MSKRIGILALAAVLAGALAWGGRSEARAWITDTAYAQSSAVWSTGAHCSGGTVHQTTLNFQLTADYTVDTNGDAWRRYRLQMWPSDGCTYANWHPWITLWVCGTQVQTYGWYWPNAAWSDNWTDWFFYRGTPPNACGAQADDVDRDAYTPWFGWLSYGDGGDLFDGRNAYICVDPTHPGCA